MQLRARIGWIRLMQFTQCVDHSKAEVHLKVITCEDYHLQSRRCMRIGNPCEATDFIVY